MAPKGGEPQRPSSNKFPDLIASAHSAASASPGAKPRPEGLMLAHDDRSEDEAKKRKARG